MKDRELIQKHIEFINSPKGTVAFLIKNNANFDCFKDIIVIYNANNTKVALNLPEGKWYLYVDKNNVYQVPKANYESSMEVEPISLTILSNTI
ncbi:hypothetical protein PL321_17935 [Caloramator sp. mosi_1]|uniref:hypothetical protein n=1 Tax=Caloramator sp. mosi_1 TaxID=3023090 RepID=UPI002360C6EA|nr:hypothetical protein [Caloramator sp. mosi_1]WDC84123.1 hypothetical protein PL321_17935 [Caloramator sp. mosi_1]